MSDIKQTSILSKTERFEENPFIEKSIVAIEEHRKKKTRFATETSRKAILSAVDTDTGEIFGHTTFVQEIEYDEDKFVKIYQKEIRAFFGLSPSAMAVFWYITSICLQPKQDRFYFTYQDCQKHTNLKKTSIS